MFTLVVLAMLAEQPAPPQCTLYMPAKSVWVVTDKHDPAAPIPARVPEFMQADQCRIVWNGTQWVQICPTAQPLESSNVRRNYRVR